MAHSCEVIELFGTRYMVTHFMGGTYSVRCMPDGEILGMFMLDDTESSLIGVHGADVPLTLEVARAVLDARLAAKGIPIPREESGTSPQGDHRINPPKRDSS
jgi:hypothetical protein